LARLKRGAAAWLSFIALLWLIQVLASVGDWDRAALAVRPHEAAGLVGVLTAPLIHGSVQHLLSNSLALGVIGTALVVGWPRASRWVVPLIWVGSGLAVWLFAREAAHLGASGLAYGMMFFVLVAGIARRDSRSVALVLIVLFLHGGMIWGILPLQAGVSFESHLAGAVWGCLCALAMRERRGPRPRPRKYQWEGKAIDDEHPAADLFRAPGDDRPDGRH
jgi:membrane associated rhomboid family serine protease